tara:strand:+ start:494 stop:1537 length:1044 start_codon:yes stop_codon:yes gene_type:complete
MYSPSFSICIPNYNYGKYIGKTIESVLKQEYGNFEIIISDNCSNDNSLEVIESFNDHRLKLVKNKYNIGYSGNLTRVTSLAKNDFIIFLPSDDLLKEGALKNCSLILSKYQNELNNLIISFQTETINHNNEIIFSSVHNQPYYHRHTNKFTLKEINSECFEYHGKDIHRKMLEKIQMPFPIQSMIFSRELFDRGGGAYAPRLIGPDKFLCLKLLSFNPKVICVEKPFAFFNYHGSPMAQAQLSTLKQQIDDYMYTIENSIKDFSNYGINKKTVIKEFLNNRCIKVGLTQLVHGTYAQAFKIFCFCLASYPKETIFRARAWVLLILLMLGPFAKILSIPLYHFYKKLN